MKGERMRKITEELRNCKERCDDIPRLVGKHLKIRTERGSIRDDAPLRGMVEHLSMEECSIGSLHDGGLLPTDIPVFTSGGSITGVRTSCLTPPYRTLTMFP